MSILFYFRQVKKGQAAIEFLMTYGWMLLVVLIVGALIFSFVDFGSLLPNQLELSNNLRAEATDMVGSAASDQVQIVFTYLGARSSTIDPNDALIALDVGGGTCTATEVTNIDTGATETPGNEVSFINGQLGLMTFECPTGQLILGDILEGEVRIDVRNPRTTLTTTSRGSIRLRIDE
ncbi:MAG: hypothetical protein ACMXYB_00875 [Candidatus Woesearchaeota archaeon]